MPPIPPLTPMRLRSLKPPSSGQAEHSDGACPGLRLRLSHGGAATWVLGCRDAAGRARRFVLADAEAVGLAKARDLARDMRERVRRGYDPIEEGRAARRAAKAPKPQAATLTLLLDGYAKAVGTQRRSWPEARRRIESVFAVHLERPLAAITRPELQVTADAHGSRSSAAAAVRYLRPVLKWGVKRDSVAASLAPASLDPPLGALKKRARKLSRDEIAAILPVLDGAGGYGRVCRWLFWTACRLNEACGMSWREIDLEAGIWTIPAERTKQAREHVVPLPAAALRMLRSLIPTDAAGQAINPDREALVFVNASGGRLTHWDRQTKVIHAASRTSGWHRHDIRRSVATLMGNLGVAPHVIEVCQGHQLTTSSDGSTLSRVATTYNRSRYQREHREALELLAAELDRIEHGESNVVRMARA